MKILIIFNREPYDNTDVTWNGLRLADKLVDAGSEVRIFLMNDAVDLARDVCRPPRRLRSGSLPDAQGFDRPWCVRQSLWNLHGALRHLQEPSVFRGRRKIHHASAGGMGHR